jgi:Mg-chelatase subunit ChlD
LGELFGEKVREEVLGEALSAGRAGAFALLESEPVTPSIELLEQVLSLKGSLPESQMEKLRRFVRRIVDQLVKELSTRLRPALAGLTTSRPTSRKTPRLDLKRTVRANLHTARANSQGRMQLVPERFLFKTLSKRSMDWHVIFVVDVSGSMEPSVIYSAMMAAIFSGLPAISVQFLAFSTQVIDFTDRVEDPLSMLMEVEVGGGTHIAKGLRAARERLRVPKRSIVLLVTDFEEGFPISGLLAEVRALVDSGAIGLGLAALSDDGKPRYNKGIAGQVVNHGMPVAALSPMELARWVGKQIR